MKKKTTHLFMLKWKTDEDVIRERYIRIMANTYCEAESALYRIYETEYLDKDPQDQPFTWHYLDEWNDQKDKPATFHYPTIYQVHDGYIYKQIAKI